MPPGIISRINYYYPPYTTATNTTATTTTATYYYYYYYPPYTTTTTTILLPSIYYYYYYYSTTTLRILLLLLQFSIYYTITTTTLTHTHTHTLSRIGSQQHPTISHGFQTKVRIKNLRIATIHSDFLPYKHAYELFHTYCFTQKNFIPDEHLRTNNYI